MQVIDALKEIIGLKQSEADLGQLAQFYVELRKNNIEIY